MAKACNLAFTRSYQGRGPNLNFFILPAARVSSNDWGNFPILLSFIPLSIGGVLKVIYDSVFCGFLLLIQPSPQYVVYVSLTSTCSEPGSVQFQSYAFCLCHKIFSLKNNAYNASFPSLIAFLFTFYTYLNKSVNEFNFSLFHCAFWFIKFDSHQFMHFFHTTMYQSFKLY